jgi:uncharacterized protein YodC (DUF2158 family)
MSLPRFDTFLMTDLVKVDTSRSVVLNSGGPLMDVLSVKDGITLCEWKTDAGKVARGRFDVRCLSRLVPYASEGS